MCKLLTISLSSTRKLAHSAASVELNIYRQSNKKKAKSNQKTNTSENDEGKNSRTTGNSHKLNWKIIKTRKTVKQY
eukprot:snap_masked-scaffold_76-processed-gene-0.26-mRNA-1 protein AED:1.00 eAED:1.00 QI:0/0/0/0/1/1/4/0/75